MLTGTLIRQYKNRQNKPMFIYGVDGPADEVADFEETQGEYAIYGEESDGKFNGKPLLRSGTKAVHKTGQKCEIRKNRSGDRFNPIEDEQLADLRAMQQRALTDLYREQLFGSSLGVAQANAVASLENDDDDDDTAPVGATADEAGFEA